MFNPLNLLGIAAAAALMGGFAGWKAHDWRDGAQQVKYVTRTVTVVQKQAAITTAVATKTQAAQDHIRYIHDTIEKEVPVEVPPAADPALPAGWVRLYDAAALDVPPDALPAEVAASAAGGARASEALRSTIDNFATAHDCEVRLNGWIDWWTGVSQKP